MLFFYSLALLAALVASAPYWLYCMAASGRHREGLRERLGFVPNRLLRDRPIIWVHAVSVGEVLAAGRLIEDLGAEIPGVRVMISTTTRTGQNLARERFGAERVFYLPLDFRFALRAYLRALQPRMLVLIESEFWPRLLAECRNAQIPVAVVNARISDRSWPRYKRLRSLWKHVLGGLALVLAQSEVDAERLRSLGAANVRVGGNLKYGIRVAQPAAITTLLREHLPSGIKVVVCGSTLAGEEELLLNSLPADAVVILAPRHPERFNEIAAMLEARSTVYVRRSQWITAPTRLQPGALFLLDSIGELASIYSLASVAFVGGGLFAAGGHNPLEPAQYGLPIVMGPHYENFRAIVDKLLAADAVVVADAPELPVVFHRLLTEEAQARAMGERARQVFTSQPGATDRTVGALRALLAPQALLEPHP
jgi:3-deoxy-D-manno-octulosonic-acid transferase